MKKRSGRRKRVFGFLLALLFVLSSFSGGSAYAQDPDTRTIINTVVATSNTDSIPGYGKSFLSPTFTVTEGAPANFKYSTGAWYKKNGGGIGKSIHNQNL